MKTKNKARYIWIAVAAVIILLIAGRFAYISLLKSENTPQWVKKVFTDSVVRQLRRDIDFGDKDILTFAENGEVASIEIKTPETAEVFFKCIRECTHICDLTGVQFSDSPPPRVIIKGTYADFGCIYLTYKVTGRYYHIGFSDENEEYFYNYVMGLRDKSTVQIIQ